MGKNKDKIRLRGKYNRHEVLRCLAPLKAQVPEQAVIIGIDKRGRPIGMESLGGICTESGIYVSREQSEDFMNDLCNTATMNYWKQAVIAHSHPCRNTEGQYILAPSKEDCMFTEQARKRLKKCGIRLIDHVIVSAGNSVPFFFSRHRTYTDAYAKPNIIADACIRDKTLLHNVLNGQRISGPKRAYSRNVLMLVRKKCRTESSFAEIKDDAAKD